MTEEPGAPEARIPRRAATACIALLLSSAAFFWRDVIGLGPGRDDIPKTPPQYTDTTPVRKVRKEMTFDGAPCKSCHEGSEPLQGDPKEKGVFHEKIELKHGRNQHCFNCHHRAQPANFSNFDGSPILLPDVQLLCAKCHGTTYRDWNLGAHGRRSGYWSQSNGGPKRTVCIACHDPHWPLFKPLESAPAPRTNPRSSGADGGHGRREGHPS